MDSESNALTIWPLCTVNEDIREGIKYLAVCGHCGQTNKHKCRIFSVRELFMC